jgi:hypothetical protein
MRAPARASEYVCGEILMKQPTQCELWSNPERVKGLMKERFELLETFFYESHQWRYLLKCRECGQLYFFEFYEEIDWTHGKDPQCSIYVPLERIEDAAALKSAPRHELLRRVPRLQDDFPKDAVTPTLRWIGKQ